MGGRAALQERRIVLVENHSELGVFLPKTRQQFQHWEGCDFSRQ